MNLYLVTPPQTRSDETALAVAFLEQGLHRLHVRKPAYTMMGYRQYIDAIPARFHHRLVLHGAAELLHSYPSIGLHLRGKERQNNAFVQGVLQRRPAFGRYGMPAVSAIVVLLGAHWLWQRVVGA